MDLVDLLHPVALEHLFGLSDPWFLEDLELLFLLFVLYYPEDLERPVGLLVPEHPFDLFDL